MTSLKDKLIEKGMKLIPMSEISIEYDNNKTIGYDFTVEDNYTFTTYDGVYVQDTMAAYVPLSEEAQKEARTKMISATRSGSINAPNFELSNEMFAGLFTLTWQEKGTDYKKVSSFDEIGKLSIDRKVLYKIKGQVQKTTAGRVIFNSVLPEWYPYVNEPIDKKKIQSIMTDIIEKSHSDFVETTDKLMDISFHYATVNPISYGLDMMSNLSPKLLKLKADLGKEKDVARQSEIIDEIEKELLVHLKKSQPDLYRSVAAGASKGTNQLRQLMVCKGLIADSEGNILPPILTSIGDGYSAQEYFDAAAGARKGTIDRALNTAHGGYSFRKVLFVCSNVQLDSTKRNCGTKDGLKIKLTSRLYAKMRGRYVIGDKGGIVPIDEKMIGSIITMRSPIRCVSTDICTICYGDLHKQLNTRNIGIAAAQEMNLSERIMKCSIGLICSKDNLFYSMDDVWGDIIWEKD